MSLNDTKVRVCPRYGNHCLCAGAVCPHVDVFQKYRAVPLNQWARERTFNIDGSVK